MLPVAHRSTPVIKARTGLRCTMEALAMGSHNLWVTRHTNSRKVGPSRIRQILEVEVDILPELTCHGLKMYFAEASFSRLSLNDENTPMQGDKEPHRGREMRLENTLQMWRRRNPITTGGSRG